MAYNFWTTTVFRYLKFHPFLIFQSIFQSCLMLQPNSFEFGELAGRLSLWVSWTRVNQLSLSISNIKHKISVLLWVLFYASFSKECFELRKIRPFFSGLSSGFQCTVKYVPHYEYASFHQILACSFWQAFAAALFGLFYICEVRALKAVVKSRDGTIPVGSNLVSPRKSKPSAVYFFSPTHRITLHRTTPHRIAKNSQNHKTHHKKQIYSFWTTKHTAPRCGRALTEMLEQSYVLKFRVETHFLNKLTHQSQNFSLVRKNMKTDI